MSPIKSNNVTCFHTQRHRPCTSVPNRRNGGPQVKIGPKHDWSLHVQREKERAKARTGNHWYTSSHKTTPPNPYQTILPLGTKHSNIWADGNHSRSKHHSFAAGNLILGSFLKPWCKSSWLHDSYILLPAERASCEYYYQILLPAQDVTSFDHKCGLHESWQLNLEKHFLKWLPW